MFVFPLLDCHKKKKKVGEHEGVSAVEKEQLVPFVHEEKLLLMSLIHLAFERKLLLRWFRRPLQAMCRRPWCPFAISTFYLRRVQRAETITGDVTV